VAPNVSNFQRKRGGGEWSILVVLAMPGSCQELKLLGCEGGSPFANKGDNMMIVAAGIHGHCIAETGE